MVDADIKPDGTDRKTTLILIRKGTLYIAAKLVALH